MTAQRWSVTADRQACIGSGLCAGTLPHLFVLRDGLSELVQTLIEADQEIVDVAEACPALAIRVVDAETGALVAPEE